MEKLSEKELVRLNENLETIQENITKLASIRYTLLRGMVNGLGVVLGATIFGTLTLGILSSIYDSIEDVPIVGPLLEDTNLEEELGSGN